jgi:group I intron endonuclease
MEKQKMFRVYLITNKVNGKIYIGKTSQEVEKRWKWHVQDANKKRLQDIHFYRALRKYGPENFTIKQIDCTENEQECNELEKLYIGVFRSHVSKIGYNGTMGGEGGRQTEEVRKKMGESRTGKNNPFYGKHHSLEAIEKNRRAHLGKKYSLGAVRSDETKRKISESHKGLLVGVRNPNFGGLSEQHKQNLSIAKLKYWKKIKEGKSNAGSTIS